MTAVTDTEAQLVSDTAARAPASIVLVGPLPPPPGGMANQTRQLAQLLGAEGCRVVVVRNNADWQPAWIGRVRGVRALFRLVPFVVRLWSAMRDASVVHVMANSGWAWHLFAAPAIWVAALRRVPVVVNYHGGHAEVFFRKQIALVRPTLGRARLVIVPSGYLQSVFAKHAIPTTIVPNVVDLESFRPQASLPVTPHLIVTRNLEQIYDNATAIRAFAKVRARVPGARMTIAGSGPERAALEALAVELEVAAAIRFTGRLDGAALPELYRSASVCVNPSLVDNTPSSLLEAMASGVPIVSTNVGGVPFLVEHERTALLVPPAAADQLAAAVLRLHGDAALAERLRAAGLDYVARFGWTHVRSTLFEAYARACRRELAPGVP